MNNGNNGGKPRQINRVATPIKVQNQNQTVQGQMPQAPQVQTGQAQVKTVVTNQAVTSNQVSNTMNNIPPKKERPKKEPKVKNVKKEDTHDPTTAVFITIMLLIFAALVAFLGLYIVPRYLENRRADFTYNDKPSTTPVLINNQIISYRISNEAKITLPSSYNVASKFNISLVSNGTNNDILVNNKKITSADYLEQTVAVVDDILLFTVSNGQNRTTKFYAVSADGEILLDIYNIAEQDGMVILSDANSVIYNSVTIVLLASRVSEGSLILDNTLGTNLGYNICNEEVLKKQNIDEAYPVYGTYSFEYLGNHKFSSPELINSTTLAEYKDTNNLCN